MSVATAFGQMCVNDHLLLTTPEQVQTLMDVLKVLYVREDVTGQYLMARCIQLIQLSDVNENIQVIVNSIFHLVFISTRRDHSE